MGETTCTGNSRGIFIRESVGPEGLAHTIFTSSPVVTVWWTKTLRFRAIDSGKVIAPDSWLNSSPLSLAWHCFKPLFGEAQTHSLDKGLDLPGLHSAWSSAPLHTTVRAPLPKVILLRDSLAGQLLSFLRGQANQERWPWAGWRVLSTGRSTPCWAAYVPTTDWSDPLPTQQHPGRVGVKRQTGAGSMAGRRGGVINCFYFWLWKEIFFFDTLSRKFSYICMH